MPRPAHSILEVRTPNGTVVPVRRMVLREHGTMRLRVTALGAQIQHPANASEHDLVGFLRKHSNWLANQIALQRQHLPRLVAGKPFQVPVGGKPTSVRWQDSARPILRTDAQGIVLHMALDRPDALTVAAGLWKTHLEQRVRTFVARTLPQHVASLGRAPTSIQIKPLQSLWGCLNSQDRLSLDLALALLPEPALHYVLVHELCHLHERNHQPAFWRLVGRQFPGWQHQRRSLQHHGSAAKSLLAHLLGLNQDSWSVQPDDESDDDMDR